MSNRDGWWNRNEGNPEGPGGVPWWVWVALALVVFYAVFAATTSGDEQPGPDDPGHSLPTPPAVIMPVNSWSS